MLPKCKNQESILDLSGSKIYACTAIEFKYRKDPRNCPVQPPANVQLRNLAEGNE
jgi:hypothetical protein